MKIINVRDHVPFNNMTSGWVYCFKFRNKRGKIYLVIDDLHVKVHVRNYLLHG